MMGNTDSPSKQARWSRRAVLRLAALGVVCATAPLAQAWQAPLERPAMPSDLIERSPLMAVVYNGERVVAAGLRGGILFSEDNGQSWQQAEVPVSTDLVAVSFSDTERGWAVGHGGVVLHSADGGRTWIKQLDGFQASRLAIDYYQRHAATLDDAELLLERERSLALEGETQPFMDVLFLNERQGYVVGTFNRIFATEDGGRSWTPLMHRTDNPGELHFYAVAGRGEQLYLAGEQGKVWRLNADSGRFVAADTPYVGTLFDILPAADDLLLAHGMRGSLYLSRDQGGSWSKVALPIESGITAALALPDGSLLVADQEGRVARSDDGARQFKAVPMSQPMPYFGAAPLSADQVVFVGAFGVRIETI